MTRFEMIAKLREYCGCTPPKDCPSCPIRKVPERGVGCEDFADRTNAELAECIEKITPTPVDAETASQVCEKVEDEEVLLVKYMIVVIRDMLLVIKRGLTMLSSSVGGTIITRALADELLIMAETIDHALSESEEVLE